MFSVQYVEWINWSKMQRKTFAFKIQRWICHLRMKIMRWLRWEKGTDDLIHNISVFTIHDAIECQGSQFFYFSSLSHSIITIIIGDVVVVFIRPISLVHRIDFFSLCFTILYIYLFKIPSTPQTWDQPSNFLFPNPFSICIWSLKFDVIVTRFRNVDWNKEFLKRWLKSSKVNFLLHFNPKIYLIQAHWELDAGH